MESWVQGVLLPIVLAMLASNGLWALIGKQREKNNVERKMLVVLDNIPQHERMVTLLLNRFLGVVEAQHTTTNTEAEAEAEVVKAALATPILTVKVETELKTQAVEEGAALMESPLVLVAPALSSFVLHNEV